LRAARVLGLPCVIGALGSDVHLRSGLAAWLTGRAIRNADGVLTVSEAMREAAVQAFAAERSRVHTIVNGFNTGVFGLTQRAPARCRLGLAQEDRLIVYVGRLVPAKGLRELVEAFTSLQAEVAGCRLALVGDGPMRGELQALIADARLALRITLTGGLPPQGVADWLGASDVLTLPSWSEGYPNVVVEALACGRPVVATDVGGTREIVREDNGILVPPRDVGALRAALAGALARRWDHAAIAAGMKRTWDDVAAETLSVCESVIAGAKVTTR
jgi:glycosyltransferase involved in cell wall biosynthesis